MDNRKRTKRPRGAIVGIVVLFLSVPPSFNAIIDISKRVNQNHALNRVKIEKVVNRKRIIRGVKSKSSLINYFK